MLPVVAEITMSTVLSDIGTAATAMIGYVSDCAETVVSNPVMLIPSAAFVIGVSIKFFKKLL